jgi:NADH-quinone oxidoreductase subunit G
MEEASELLERLAKRAEYKWPMFTSCCPGWVRYLKAQYPEMILNLSTAKSPQQMFGAVLKTWFAQREGIDPDKIVVVSIMPCVAKKHECALPVMNDAKHGQDVDIVITSREFANLIKACNINTPELLDEEFDSLLGEGTGAGIIFGASGGVMEAALRSAYYFATGKNPDPDAFSEVRADFGLRELTADINGTPVRAAVASGLGKAKEIIEKIKSGQADYDFVEIMACPGGCSGGGGQPIKDGDQPVIKRNAVLYDLDKKSRCRFSHENSAVLKAYEEFFGKPLSHKSEQLLHSDHTAWDMPV